MPRKNLQLPWQFLFVLAGTLVAAFVGWHLYDRSNHTVSLLDVLSNRVNSNFAPGPITVPSAAESFTVHNAVRSDGTAIQINYPVSMVLRQGSEYYVCNYSKLILVNLDECRAWEVAPPKGLTTEWTPTALAYDAIAKKLYVATYTGGNVLVLDASEPTHATLAGVVNHSAMKGPEGVALSDDRQFVAVADYDGDQAMLFDSKGQLLWKKSVAGCHGIAFGRLKDGETSVCATSLAECAVCQFDLKGNLLRKARNLNWIERDSYLYPTSLVACKDHTTALTDAFRGQIAVLDEEIHMVNALGGNGPGVSLFNNPYSCCWDQEGKKLFVVDTFKDRIVEVNFADRSISKVYWLTDSKNIIPNRLERESDLVKLTSTSPSQMAPVQSEAFGTTYDNHVDMKRTVTIPLPRFEKRVSSRIGTKWHPRINGLVSTGSSGTVAWSTGLNMLFTDYPFRFIFAGNYEYQGHTYLLLMSPQCSDVLVCGCGATVPIRLHKDMWLMCDDLVGPDLVVPAARVVELGAERIAAYLERLSSKKPTEAIREAFFSKMSKKTFAITFQEAAMSPEGKEFAAACIGAKTAEEQCAAAERFYVALGSQTEYYLSEVMLAEMILCAKGK